MPAENQSGSRKIKSGIWDGNPLRSEPFRGSGVERRMPPSSNSMFPSPAKPGLLFDVVGPFEPCRNFLAVCSSFSSMMDPAPYQKIAVASTFSPRFEQVLSEAKRMSDRFNASLSLIYVGEESPATA